jgi:hypothetical protein
MIAFGRAAPVWLALAAALAGGCRDHAASESPACAADEYRAYEPALCGKGKRPGKCRPKPTACDGAAAPVCGCDGKVYPSECAAHAAGVDLDVNGRCHATIRDFIPCGPRFCDARTSYCEIVLSDVVEPPTDSTCKPLPPSCRPDGDVTRACSCFPARTRCLSFCGQVPTGGVAGFHLTCRL